MDDYLQAWYDLDFKIKKMLVSIVRHQNYLKALTLSIKEAN